VAAVAGPMAALVPLPVRQNLPVPEGIEPLRDYRCPPDALAAAGR
jgi:hypothetical protein